MAFARCELRIHTPGGVERSRIPQGAFERLSYKRQLNAVGTLTMRFKDGEDARIDAIPRYALIDVWRTKANGGSWRREDTYLLKRRTVSAGSDGLRVVTLGADHLNTLLEGCICAPLDETGIEVTGYAEVVMKDLVSAWAGPGAPAAQQIENLLVDAYTHTGLWTSESPRRKRLSTVLQSIAKAAHVDFCMKHLGDGKLLFTADRPWGRDLRYEAHRYTPRAAFTLFSLGLGNMENPTLTWTEADLDRVIALGEGEGDDRETLEVAGGSVNLTRFNKRSDVADARRADEGDEDALRVAGEAALRGGLEKRELRFDVPSANTGASGYGNEWDLGDWVSATFDGATFDYKIAAVDVSLDANGEQITPRLESI